MTMEAPEGSAPDSGRRGGRDARRAARARPLSDQDRPIWPGMPGGKYQVLTPEDMQKIVPAGDRRVLQDERHIVMDERESENRRIIKRPQNG